MEDVYSDDRLVMSELNLNDSQQQKKSKLTNAYRNDIAWQDSTLVGTPLSIMSPPEKKCLNSVCVLRKRLSNRRY